MAELDRNQTLSAGDLSVDSILAEFKAEQTVSATPPPAEKKSTYEAPSDHIYGSPAYSPEPESEGGDYYDDEYDDSEEDGYYDEPTLAEKAGNLANRAFSFVNSFRRKPEPEEAPEYESENEQYFSADEINDFGNTDYASAADYPSPSSDVDLDYDEDEADYSAGRSRKASRQRHSISEDFLAPIVGLLAMLSVKKQQREELRASQPPEPPPPDVPEMAADKASKFYNAQLHTFRMRGKIALFLCVLLVYISYAFNSSLPLFGALGSDIGVCAMLCVIIQLSVMLTGLDIFAAGIASIFRGELACESLASISCILSLLDACIIAYTRDDALGLPFCAVSSLSLLFAIFGSRLNCSAMRESFFTLAHSASPYAVLHEQESAEGKAALMKFRIPVRGFIHRTEEPDLCEEVYLSAGPILLAASAALAVVASVKTGLENIFHILSMLVAVSAALSSFICFPLPFSAAARALLKSGAAIAGWSGCAEVGKAKRVVVTDSDIFPAGNLKIDTISLVEGLSEEKVLSYAGSVLAASGCSLASSFTEHMRLRGYTMQKVEDFSCHDGGGFKAFVNGEHVYVGSSGFMQLMSVKLPPSVSGKTAVYAAINGRLAGVFTVEYTAVASVQYALVTLLRGKKPPFFATRDVNVSPLLIKQLFKIPTEGLDFSSFTDRCEVAAIEPDADSIPAAVLVREGLLPLVRVSEVGARLYWAVKIGTFLSVLGSVLGVVIMFFLSWTGNSESASVSNALTFMLLWVLPTLALTFNITR